MSATHLGEVQLDVAPALVIDLANEVGVDGDEEDGAALAVDVELST